MTTIDPRRVLLVCSSGGHLTQLHNLAPWWTQRHRRWVTFGTPDAVSLLKGEAVTWAFHPTTRNAPNAARNLRLAWTVVREYAPDLVVSSGAGVAVPFFVVARALGVRTAYVEVYDRIDLPTLTGRLCYPITDVFALQWDSQRRFYPRGHVVGRLL